MSATACGCGFIFAFVITYLAICSRHSRNNFLCALSYTHTHTHMVNSMMLRGWMYTRRTMVSEGTISLVVESKLTCCGSTLIGSRSGRSEDSLSETVSGTVATGLNMLHCAVLIEHIVHVCRSLWYWAQSWTHPSERCCESLGRSPRILQLLSVKLR